jgi:hypothetical protein
VITSTSDGIEKQIFPAAENRCQQSRKSYGSQTIIALASVRTNQRTAIPNYTGPHVRTNSLGGGQTGEVAVKCQDYRGTSVLLCSVSLISVVEPQFLLYV